MSEGARQARERQASDMRERYFFELRKMACPFAELGREREGCPWCDAVEALGYAIEAIHSLHPETSDKEGS